MNDCRLLVNISDYIHPDDGNECWLDNNKESIGAFPPKLLNFLDADMYRQPTVTVNKERSNIFNQYKGEYNLITKITKRLPGGADEKIQSMDGFELFSGDHQANIYNAEQEKNEKLDEDLFDESVEPDDICPHYHYRVLQEQGIRMMTWTQPCSAWWNCRPLYLTSLDVDKLVIAAVPHIDMSHPMRPHFERILKYTGHN